MSEVQDLMGGGREKEMISHQTLVAAILHFVQIIHQKKIKKFFILFDPRRRFSISCQREAATAASEFSIYIY